MSLRRRDLFWQESEKGGGPGDGDTIVYAANVTRPGLIQKNLIWRSGLAQDIAFLSWTDNDRELLAGNPLLSPDGTYIIWPSVERVEITGEPKRVPGIAGIYRGTNDTDWEVVKDPNGTRVLASKSGLGNRESSIFTFMPEARVNLYVCTDGENGYDYLTVSQNGTELYNGKNESQQGATSFRYAKLTVEPGTEVTLTYQKDLSNSMYSDRAYAYIGGVEGIGGTITLDSTTWEVSGTLASGQTVYKSAIKGQAFKTASAYIRIQPTETGSLVLMCRSNGEERYDYLRVYELDSTTSVLKSFESETSATDYTAVEFNIPDTESHFIYVEYVKDGSGDAGEDAAFIYTNSGQYNMDSTVEATGTVTSYCRSFEKYKLDTGTRTAYTYSYSSTTLSDLLNTEYGVPQFLVPKTFDSDTVTFNEGHMSSSDYKYIPVYASARLSNTGLELTTGSTYTSESVMSQTRLLYGAVKYSDNGDLFCTIPLSGSYNSIIPASEYFQSASKCVYLSRRVNDTDYVSERILDLLPVDSGSTSTVVVDAAFNRTGKITYMIGNQLTESTVVTFSSHLYRSTDKTVSFEHLDWAPSDSSEYITAVCTNFSGKVVYVLTGTFSYNKWVSASVYRSEDYGRTFNRQNKFKCKGPSYVSGSVDGYLGDSLQAAINALDPRYRMQIACSGKGDRLAVWLVSGSDWQPHKNQGLIFRSDDSGLTWSDPVETDRSISHSRPRILIMNRN